MLKLKEAALSTLYHVLELACCLVAALVILRHFNLGTEETRVVVGVAVNALVKFSRAHPDIPIEDYVNR